VRRPARPRESAGYPLPTGLGKFDLGSIPASVTPPSSWRRAAWFAVGASILVAVGLIVVTISLVSRPSKGDTIRAFPGLPTQQMLPTGLATSTGSSSSKSRASGSASGSASNGPGARPGGPGNAADLFSGRPTGVSGTSGSTSPYAAQPTTRPSRSTENAYPVAVTDPQKMGDRTEAYYRTVTEDPSTAYSMTTGQMRSEGEEALRKRYENVSRVEVQKMTVDPTTSRCTATVKLVNKDGTASTEQRELSFSSGDDPKINSESAG